MGIAHIFKQFRRRAGEWREDGTVGYTAEWIVTSESVLDDAADILSDNQMLEQFTSFASDNRATLRDIRADQLDSSPYVWTVRFEYDSKSENSTAASTDPLLEPAKVRWTSTPLKIAAVKDKDDEAILNKAGDRYDPPLEIDLYLPTVTIERVELGYSPSGAIDFLGSVNSDPFAGAPARHAMLTTYDGDSFVYTNESGAVFIYWNVTYQIIFHPLGWDPEVLEQGYYEKVGGNKTRIKDDADQPVSEPFVLTSAGAKGNPDEPVFTTWEVHRETSFSALGLGGIL